MRNHRPPSFVMKSALVRCRSERTTVHVVPFPSCRKHQCHKQSPGATFLMRTRNSPTAPTQQHVTGVETTRSFQKHQKGSATHRTIRPVLEMCSVPHFVACRDTGCCVSPRDNKAAPHAALRNMPTPPVVSPQLEPAKLEPCHAAAFLPAFAIPMTSGR